MKKYNLKLSLRLLSVLGTCALVSPFSLRGDAPTVHKQIHTAHVSQNTLTDDEVTFLADKLDKLSEWIQYSKKRFDLFFNKTNKESFSQHVENMYQDIARFHTDFIVPVEKELAEHCPMTTAYKNVLQDALSLMKKFETNLVLVHKILNNPKYMPSRSGAGNQANKLALGLAAELKKFSDQSEKQNVNMLKQVDTMQKNLVNSNPVLAQKITAITINLQKMSQNPPKPLTLLNGLTARLRCASMPRP